MFDDKEEEGAEAEEEENETGQTQLNTEGASSIEESVKVAEEQLYLQNEEEKFEADILKIDEEWRDLARESKYYPDELYSEIFEPKQPWTKWQTTKEYSVQTRMSDRNLICVYSKANVNTSLDNLVKVIEDVDIRSQ